MILALETATEVCSVALELDGGEVVERRFVGRGMHSEKLFLYLEELISSYNCRPAALKELLISRGPGQYTGLRIGASAVKGFLFEESCPLYSLGTLEGFAAGLICDYGVKGTIHAVLDARRRHLYHQRVKVGSDGIIHCNTPSVRPIVELQEEVRSGEYLVGTGLDRLDLVGMKRATNNGVYLYGESAISAGNLILARRDERFSLRFRKENADRFDPEYLTDRQTVGRS